MKKLRAAVIGAGRLGRYHIAKYAARDDVELVAVADVAEASLRGVPLPAGCRAVRDFREFLPGVDLVSIAVPTAAHHEVARACLEAGAHVLIEKPVTRTLEEADELIALAGARGLCLAVGHIERFNPAFAALQAAIARPLFVESERLAAFGPRGTDIDVVLDLMIHDIDLALALSHAELVTVIACGYRVITDSIDIAYAHLEFGDGMVAILSASRVSQAPVRKLRAFARNAYASADLKDASLKVARRPDGAGIAQEERSFPGADALGAEIDAFVAAVRRGRPPPVGGAEGRRALAVALEVGRCIGERLERLSAAAEGRGARPFAGAAGPRDG
jgi:predicted dehydrogenase